MGGKFENTTKEWRQGFKNQEKRMTEIIEEMRGEYKKQMKEWEKEKKFKKDMAQIMNQKALNPRKEEGFSREGNEN